MFTGNADILADLTDSRWTRDRIGDNVVHYEEINAGHLTFMVGKDMSYFSEGVMGLLRQYHPVVVPDYFKEEKSAVEMNFMQ